jgi:lycopene beta-cyclase
MDWTPPGLEQRSGDAGPTFLYAMDLGDGSVLVEETALAATPPVGDDELRARLVARLERLGTVPVEVAREEHVRIPLGGPVPRPQAVAAIGAAAGLVHPATGYSVAASLRAAPRLAAAVRRALVARAAPDGVAAAAWAAVWPGQRRRARRLEQVGLSRLLTMDGDQVRGFFDAFFALPVERWAPYLSGDASASAVALTMAAVFRSSPAGVRRRLARG